MAYEQEFDLGLVTAYAYAVSKGYTGTEEEFAELMASYATVAEAAEAAAAAAAASASDAAGSASTATTKANNAAASANDAAGSATTASAKADEASASATSAAGNASVATTKAGEAASSASAAAGSASTASTKAGEASTSATNANTAKVAAQAAQTAAETAQGKAEDAQEAAEAAAEQAEATLGSYAKVDGSYNSMTVGNAEQLVATVAVEDSVPYNFRTSGGTADIGDREVDKLVGGTVAWNQKVQDVNAVAEVYGITRTKVEANGKLGLRYSGTSTQTTNFTAVFYYEYVSGHKYLWDLGIKLPAGCKINVSSRDQCSVVIAAPTQSSGFGISINEGTEVDFVAYPMSFDLTQMFGSTIADYIYSLETATPGAGVAWFRKLFPKPYYAYNPGELMSVQAAAHKMVGFNAWDGEYEVGGLDGNGEPEENSIRRRAKNFIRVQPSTTYYYNQDASIYYYDASQNYIGRLAGFNTARTFVTPSNCGYLKFMGQVNYGNFNVETFCINLSWDGERDGEYEPYAEYTYPLDDTLTLRGIPKLDSGNGLYYDGDIYESDGTVTRRYGVVTYDGSEDESWTVQQNGTAYIRCDTLVKTNYYIGKIIASNLNTASHHAGTPLHASERSVSGYNDNTNDYPGQNWIYVYINDSITTKAALTSWLAQNPVTVVYELATPTTETADPFQSPQIVDDFGTEEYVDAGVAAETRDVAVPVGHDTLYQANLRAKLEMAPDSPDGDGDYIVRQTNGTNAYVPLTKELPAAPTTEGTYHLKATVTSGGVTLTWEADT